MFIFDTVITGLIANNIAISIIDVTRAVISSCRSERDDRFSQLIFCHGVLHMFPTSGWCANFWVEMKFRGRNECNHSDRRNRLWRCMQAQIDRNRYGHFWHQCEIARAIMGEFTVDTAGKMTAGYWLWGPPWLAQQANLLLFLDFIINHNQPRCPT